MLCLNVVDSLINLCITIHPISFLDRMMRNNYVEINKTVLVLFSAQLQMLSVCWRFTRSLNSGSWSRGYESIWSLVLCLHGYIRRRKNSGMLFLWWFFSLSFGKPSIDTKKNLHDSQSACLLIKKPVCKEKAVMKVFFCLRCAYWSACWTRHSIS